MNFSAEIELLFFLYSAIIVGILLVSSIMFLQEKEARATRRSFILLLISILTFCMLYLFSLSLLFIVISGLTAILLVSILIPFSTNQSITDTIPLSRIDERDTMFSRNELVPDTLKFENYYAKNPDKKVLDDLFRKEPGLLRKGTKYYHKKAYRMAEENFEKVELLYDRIEGLIHKPEVEVDKSTITNTIKKYTLELGALAAGIAQSKEYHYYTHKGRREEYDNEIVPSHKYAIAFTVEMGANMVAAAPQASIVVESSKQYLNAGSIAVELAEKIRSMGYEARAHIDGNYQLVCPLVARDAGLGEIGRMGLLMTPDYGPRVRIGVVTTNLELESDLYKKDHSMLEFCKWCKKCAESCPGQSISYKNPEVINGIKRWQINQESCFTFWCKAGTDCGRCLAVCPYSHPNYSLHKLIRFGINKSKVFRYLAVYLDDFFYGRKPQIKKLPF